MTVGILGLALLTGTWTVVLVDSLQSYSGYVRDYYAACDEMVQRALEEQGLHVTPAIVEPFWAWDGGALVLFAGLALLDAWTLVVLSVHARGKR